MPPQQIAQLVELTRLRELLAREEVMRISAEIAQIDRTVAELADRTYLAQSAEDAAVLSKWQIWRREEQKRLNTRKAALMAEHRAAAEMCGRMTAEHEVLLELHTRAVKETARERDAGGLTFPDARCR